MNINVSHSGDQGQIKIEGDIDERSSEEMKSCFRQLPIGHMKLVTVDFAQVTHIGSAGIGKLLVFYKELAVHGGNLSIVNVSPAIHQMFCEMRLNTVFNISRLSTRPADKGESSC